MPRYHYTLTTRKPMSAGAADARGNTRRAHQIIPGGTIRGALAAAWWRGPGATSSAASDDFATLFDTQLLVGQAVPDDFELVSASATICKYRSQPECATVVQERGHPDRPHQWGECWSCGGPLVASPGWRRRPGPAAHLVSRTRGALTPQETAAEGQLFSRQAVAGTAGAPLRLSGLIDAPAGALDWLGGTSLRVGGGRSVDLGSCSVDMAAADPPPLPEGEKLLFHLISPGIILDRFGGADLSMAALRAELQRVAQQPELEITGSPRWLRSESVTGWHMRSRLPKPHDWALAAGSAAVVTGLSEDGWVRLQRGIGYRTLEGFGQVALRGPAELPDEPTNAGIAALNQLRDAVPKLSQWQKIRHDLLSVLKQLQAADPAKAELLRTTTTFPGLMGEQQGKATAVLRIPVGHIPGTITKLGGM
ncbi:MAG: hypothetical protein ACK5LN_03865 [Propioniciclava sp.]